jgi:hypothetical protein
MLNKMLDKMDFDSFLEGLGLPRQGSIPVIHTINSSSSLRTASGFVSMVFKKFAVH